MLERVKNYDVRAHFIEWLYISSICMFCSAIKADKLTKYSTKNNINTNDIDDIMLLNKQSHYEHFMKIQHVYYIFNIEQKQPKKKSTETSISYRWLVSGRPTCIAYIVEPIRMNFIFFLFSYLMCWLT